MKFRADIPAWNKTVIEAKLRAECLNQTRQLKSIMRSVAIHFKQDMQKAMGMEASEIRAEPNWLDARNYGLNPKVAFPQYAELSPSWVGYKARHGYPLTFWRATGQLARYVGFEQGSESSTGAWFSVGLRLEGASDEDKDPHRRPANKSDEGSYTGTERTIFLKFMANEYGVQGGIKGRPVYEPLVKAYTAAMRGVTIRVGEEFKKDITRTIMYSRAGPGWR